VVSQEGGCVVRSNSLQQHGLCVNSGVSSIFYSFAKLSNDPCGAWPLFVKLS
jgi:hypothetical protein